MNAPVHGLILAGGRSSRMRRDKATLSYGGGASQIERVEALLGPRVAECHLSIRADQADEPTRRDRPQIHDRPGIEGPLAGILAAFDARPDAAWLVVACDLPFLDAATLDALLAGRDASRTATAYRSAHDGLPEPLCALYEPRARDALERWAASGRKCPRKFLIESDAALLDLAAPDALDNINSTDEYRDAMRRLDSGATPRRLNVQYYALLREQAGRASESLETRALTPRELYDELRTRHAFTLSPDLLRVAINEEFGDWSQPLADGDAVVFIPPVAGG